MMTITLRRARAATACGLCAAALFAGAAAAQEVVLPLGARETVSRVTPLGRYDLPIGSWTGGSGLPVASLEGEVRRTAWRLSGSGITTGQVLGPIRDQLMAAGFDILFECSARTCGGFDFRFATDVLRAPNMYVDLSDFRFLSAKSADASQALSLLVSRDGDTIFVQVIQIGPPGRAAVAVSTAVAPDLSTPLPQTLGDVGARLEREGYVVLADLEFASGSAALGEGPVTSLDALAAYLRANPTQKVAIVGHTDATGSLAANITLSRQRAEAAIAYLGAQNVQPTQVTANGVGYLAPRASNRTAEGREANRRVEAVLVTPD